jgi:hypothetical protein
LRRRYDLAFRVAIAKRHLWHLLELHAAGRPS